MTDEEIKNKAKETSGGNYYYEQGFIYGFELGEENGRKELEKENTELKDGDVARFEIWNKRLEFLEKENAELEERIKDLLKPPLYDGYSLQKENAELKEALNERKEIIAELKAQIIDIKEDVERERNKQRRLENDFTTDVLNSLLQKWEITE